MANLPAEKTQSSPSLSDLEETIAELISRGVPHTVVARRLAPDDKKKQKAIRQKIKYMSFNHPVFQEAVAKRAKGELTLGLGAATRGLVKRAARGRVDAVKLLYEATGFHNPKVQHEHSGDINVNLNLPRPALPHEAEPVVDAEVVEDTDSGKSAEPTD